MNHLDALELRLSNERVRLAAAKRSSEIELRTVWVAQIEKEIAAEKARSTEVEMSDDELLAELSP